MTGAQGGMLSVFKSIGLVFLGLSLLTVTMPILAMAGGQWGRWLFLRIGGNSISRGGRGASGRDLFFHPQSHLWPLGAFIYAVCLILILYYGMKSYKNNRVNELKLLFAAYIALPFIGVAASYASGFDYSKCKLPTAGAVCVSPTHTIVYVLINHLEVTILPLALVLFWYKMLGPKPKKA